MQNETGSANNAARWSRRSVRVRGGFTLIEILIVIVIMAVVSGVVVPAFANMWERSQFDGACSNAQAIFSWARQQAIERDTEVTVHFDSGAQMFTATLTPPAAPTDQPTAIANQSVIDTGLAITKTYQLSPAFRITGFRADAGLPSGPSGAAATGGDIVFRGDGTVNSAEFMIMGRTGSKRFVLSPATGVLKAIPDGAGGGR